MYKLFSDGGSRGNPGKAASAFFILDAQNILFDFGGKYLGINTNNQAEYEGLILGLQHASKIGISELECFLDSELVVKQINGQYKVSNAEIRTVFNKVIELKNQFKKITFNHVPRAENKNADRLVNIILDTLV